MAAALAGGLRELAARAGVPLHVTQTTGLLTLFFSDGPVAGYEDAKRCDTGAHGAFCRAMLERGVYLPPSQFEAWFPVARPHRRARGADPRRRRRVASAGGRVSALQRVVEAVDPALAEHAAADPGPDRFAALVADEDRLFVLEAVYEGYLLHYGEPRAFRGMDGDLRLLAGDALYALGLSRLADNGDLPAVAELSDLISLTARAQAEGRPEDADAAWSATARALSRPRTL